jgi:hypothetical protein
MKNVTRSFSVVILAMIIGLVFAACASSPDQAAPPELTLFNTASVSADSPPRLTKNDTFNAGGAFGVQTGLTDPNKQGGAFYFDFGPAGKVERQVPARGDASVNWNFSTYTIPAGTAPGTYTCAAYFVNKKGAQSNTLTTTYKVE